MTVKNYASPNRYRVFWKGFQQPMNGITWQDAKSIVLTSLMYGSHSLTEFKICDKWGVIDINIVNDPKADPTKKESYITLFN